MASSSLFFHSLISISVMSSIVFCASVVEDLNNLLPPQDFNSIITKNCITNPSLRYCTKTQPLDLQEIFKFTIVASHLCNESKNTNCVDSFTNINLPNRPRIAPLYLSFDFFWKYCPLTILSIDFSNNSLKGPFPSDILHCSQIQSLDFSHNHLHGHIPVHSFSSLTNLTFLNLSYNYFSQSQISDAHFFQQFNSSSFIHSGLSNRRGYKIIFFIGVPIFMILSVVIVGWLCYHRPDFLPEILKNKHKFTMQMLSAATNGFSKKNLVGKSEGVEMYKGRLRDGTRVRIEIYRGEHITREKWHKMVEECRVFVQMEHENIVRMLGWCKNRKLRGIVSEWIEGGNVEMWLSNGSWKQRLRIMMGVLQGMSYLHDHWPEVGYDIRPSSILLSENHVPLISRFKIEDENSSRRRKIYKFGLLVLEMVAKRKIKDELERGGEASFIEHLRMCNRHDEVIDEGIRRTGDECLKAVELGLMCTDVGRQPSSFVQLYDMMTKLYSLNHKMRRSHPETKVHGMTSSQAVCYFLI